jgi:hypothetical protein
MCDGLVHPSRTMIIRIVLYKDRFHVSTKAGDITIKIVLNRRDVSGQDCQIHASSYLAPNPPTLAAHSQNGHHPPLSHSLFSRFEGDRGLPTLASGGGGGQKHGPPPKYSLRIVVYNLSRE